MGAVHTLRVSLAASVEQPISFLAHIALFLALAPQPVSELTQNRYLCMRFLPRVFRVSRLPAQALGTVSTEPTVQASKPALLIQKPGQVSLHGTRIHTEMPVTETSRSGRGACACHNSRKPGSAGPLTNREPSTSSEPVGPSQPCRCEMTPNVLFPFFPHGHVKFLGQGSVQGYNT